MYDKLMNTLSETKQDLVYMIAYFSLPQPFKVLGKQLIVGSYYIESSVKIKGRRVTLFQADLERVNAEEFLHESIRVYKAKKASL